MIISNLEHLETVKENAVQGGQIPDEEELISGAAALADSDGSAQGLDVGFTSTSTLTSSVSEINNKVALSASDSFSAAA
jgi:hypothetical protein